MNDNGNKRGAIILGADSQGLGIARALAKAETPIIVFTWELGSAQFSRYVNKVLKVQSPYKEDIFLESCKRHIKEFGLFGWVAYPTDDISSRLLLSTEKNLIW